MRAYNSTLLAIFVLGITEIAVSQDVILKKDNTTVLSKVLEITNTEIKYKKWSNQDGPTYSISRAEVTRINFQNGDVESFTSNVMPTPTPQQNGVTYLSVQTPTKQTQTEPEKTQSPYARGRVQFSLNGGIAIPMGDFGVTDNNKPSAAFSFGGNDLDTRNGAATTGFNASMRLHIPVFAQGKDIIGVPLKLNVMYNGFTDIEKRHYREKWQSIGNMMNEQYGSNAYQFQVTKYSNYLNFSLMGGADYTHYVSKSFALFTEANIGLNIAKITNSDISNLRGGTLAYLDYDNYIQYYSGDGMEVKYKTKVNFVYEIGGGLFLFDHLSVGVFYTGYSPFQVSPTLREYSSNYADEQGNYEDAIELTAPKLKVSVVSIQLGVHF